MPAAIAVFADIPLDLVLLSTAVLGLAIISAVTPLGGLVQSILLRLPWPLSIAASAAVNATQSAILGSVTWSAASANALASAISAPWQAIWTVAHQTTFALESVLQTLQALRYGVIPQLQIWAVQEIGIAYTAAVAAATDLTRQAELRADLEYDAATALAAEIGLSAFAHADQVALAVLQVAEQDVSIAIGRADQEFGAAVAHADAAAAQLALYAEQLAAQSIAYAQALAADELGHLEQVQAAILDYVQQLAGDLAGQIAAGDAAALGYAGAAVGAVAAAVTAIEQSPCFQACDALGGLGGLLQALGDAGMAGLLLAMAAELAADPQGAATALESVAGGLVTRLVSDLGGAAGVAGAAENALTRFGGPALAA